MLDLSIKNCKIVSPDGIIAAAIGIENGKIAAVSSEANLPKSDRTIDAKDNYVIPGVIDPHQHWASATGSLESDARTETQAAAYGGVTTVMTTIRPAFIGGEYLQTFDTVKKWLNDNATVNIALTITIMSEQHIKEIPEYATTLGITSYKCLLGYKGEQAEKIKATSVDDGIIYSGFRQVKKIGYPTMIMVHCENADVMAVLRKEVVAQGRKDLAAYTAARPAFCEAEAMRRLIYLTDVTNSRFYIPHVSIAEGVDLVAHAKAMGTNVIAETCPHYLTYTKDCDRGPLAVVNPPLRESGDVNRLWEAIDQGIIDCIGTDHCVRFRRTKETVWDNTPGFPGVETLLPVMLSEGVNKGRISLERLVAVCSSNTAKIWGLYPRKGTISVGADADLDIIDLKKEVTFTSEDVAASGGASDFSIYDGWKFKGVPIMSMVKGKVVMEDRKVVGKKGDGEYLPRRPVAINH